MKAKQDFTRAARRRSAASVVKKTAPPRGQGSSFAPAPPAPTGPAPPMPKSAQGMQLPKVPVGWKAPQQPAQSVPEKIAEQETEKNPK